jgi:diguanylate cyclase (GGDEF) domain
MSRRDPPDRRANPARKVSSIVVFPGMVPRGKVWLLVLVGLGLTGFADAVTGYDLWFGPFYLLVIGFAAWMLGRWQALAVGLAVLTLIICVNGFSLYPFGTVAALWNLAMRVITILMFIGLLGHIRCCYAREWRLARTDSLTGALNRQAFFELTATSSTSADWTMFAYADLDGLKKLNDERGHAAGDDGLIAYVAHVRSVIRKHDHFARLGGDEFIIHLKVRDEASARTVAARLHREMNAIVAQVHPNLKCSVGVLILPPGNRALDREVLAADQLMYAAKEQGAGLVVATLRDVRGSQFLVEHQTSAAGLGCNPVLNSHFDCRQKRELDTAA